MKINLLQMINSMTAFAQHKAQGDWGTATWEIRSINHRFLDLNLRLPEALNALEPLLREQTQNHLQRGRLDITLHYQPASSSQGLNLNQALITQLIQAQQAITVQLSTTTTIDPTRVLQWPGVIQTRELDLSSLSPLLLEAFKQALNKLINARQREGTALQNLLEQRLQQIENIVSQVSAYLPTVLQEQRTKILARLDEAKINLDPNRLEQEMVLFAQRIDVAEEIERLQTHAQEMRRVLEGGGAVGRRLDFLLQEFNREANTLGSKSAASETTLAAVELKVLIEQMREQVQNIE